MLRGDSTERGGSAIFTVLGLLREMRTPARRQPLIAASANQPSASHSFGLLARISEESLPLSHNASSSGEISCTLSNFPLTTWHQHATLVSKGRPSAKLEEPGNKELWSQGRMLVAPVPVTRAQGLESLAEPGGQNPASRALCPCEIHRGWGGGRGSTVCG